MAELPQETLLEAAASGPQGQQTLAAVVAAEPTTADLPAAPAW
jgi:hypothetical protein